MAKYARLQQAVKALVLLGLGIFLYTRFTSGLLYFYIAERFAWITLLAVFGFLAVGLSYDVRRKPAHAQDAHDHVHSDHVHDEHVHDEHVHDDDTHGHDAHHGHDHTLRWSAIVLVALPIVLGVLISPRPLGAEALANREITVSETRSSMPALVRAAAQKPSTALNVLEWQQLLASMPDLSSLAETEAKVVGFVYRDDRFAADQFFLARFTISCCVADATPAGLVVQTPDAANWQNDQWVEVAGAIAQGDFNGMANPVLIAESITTAEIPAQPYLYP